MARQSERHQIGGFLNDDGTVDRAIIVFKEGQISLLIVRRDKKCFSIPWTESSDVDDLFDTILTMEVKQWNLVFILLDAVHHWVVENAQADAHHLASRLQAILSGGGTVN